MRLRITKASAAIALVAASALAGTGVAGAALAAGQGPAETPVQLTGSQLAAALLPAGTFPAGYRYDSSLAYNSGRRLEKGAPKYRLATISCTSLSNDYGRSGFGETAVAANDYSTLVDNYAATVSAVFVQTVYQFDAAKTAMSFWNGLRSAAVRCPGWGLGSQFGSSRPSERIFTVPIRGAHAFQADVTVKIKPIGSIGMQSLLSVQGQDVFETDAVGLGRSVPTIPSVRALIGRLIARVRSAR